MFNLCKNFEWQLALKFTKRSQSKKDKFISFIASLSMLGIALGVAALIIIISVMNGFQKEVRDKMLSVLSHIELSYNPNSQINLDTYKDKDKDKDKDNNFNWQNIVNNIKNTPILQKNIIAMAPYVQGQAMLLANGGMYGLGIRGVDTSQEPKVSNILHNIPINTLYENSFKILIGNPLAEHLNVKIGDKITLALANNNPSILGITPRLKSVQIAGMLDTGHYEFDSSLIIMHIKDAQKLFMLDDISGMRIKLHDMNDAPQAAYNIEQKFPYLQAKDWGQQNKTWFSAVQTEKRMMFIILSLMVAVAAFNLVSTLVMSVKDKQGNIAVMRTFGATRESIRRIFIYQGLIIGVTGTILGAVFGVLIAYNVGVIVEFIEKIFQTKFLPQSIYLISSMPSDPRILDISIIIAGSIFMTILATIYPSYRASKLYPADILRHE